MTDFGSAREAELAAEAASWDLSRLEDATLDGVPVIDLSPLRSAPDDPSVAAVLADQIAAVNATNGFHLLVGHGVDTELEAAFAAARSFFALDEDTKRSIVIDHPDAPVGGIGYLPVGTRRLPTRAKGNLNEAILFKVGDGLALADNLWPPEATLRGFRAAVAAYERRVHEVARLLVPLHALALGLPSDFFADPASRSFARLRMTRYARVDAPADDEFGIAPHVDTTFLTVLAQSAPGLVIQDQAADRWLRVPCPPGALVVNTGELLRQWSNDTVASVRHFVPPQTETDDRISIPYFFNVDPDHEMVCLPTCTGPDRPPRYPPVSYRTSQAAAQRE